MLLRQRKPVRSKLSLPGGETLAGARRELGGGVNRYSAGGNSGGGGGRAASAGSKSDMRPSASPKSSGWGKVRGAARTSQALARGVGSSATSSSSIAGDGSAAPTSPLRRAISPGAINGVPGREGGAGSKASMRPSVSPKANSWSKARRVVQATAAFSGGESAVRSAPVSGGVAPVSGAATVSGTGAATSSDLAPTPAENEGGSSGPAASNAAASLRWGGLLRNSKSMPAQQRPQAASLSGEAVVERAMAVQDELRAWRERQGN